MAKFALGVILGLLIGVGASNIYSKSLDSQSHVEASVVPAVISANLSSSKDDANNGDAAYLGLYQCIKTDSSDRNVLMSIELKPNHLMLYSTPYGSKIGHWKLENGLIRVDYEVTGKDVSWETFKIQDADLVRDSIYDKYLSPSGTNPETGTQNDPDKFRRQLGGSL